MQRALIAIVDAASARLYTYQADGESQDFVEQLDLVNAGRRAKDGDLFSDTSPGTRNAISGIRGGVDDHRDAHRGEMDTKFASEVIGEIERLATERGLGHIVFVTPPKMLGVLRPHFEMVRKHGFIVDELERDLSRLSAAQIHDHLAKMDVIEPRRRAVQPRR
jgi:protein required for attachment to host cells